MTNEAKPRVFVVDDDRSVLTALSRLLGLAGYDVAAFSSSIDFLAGFDPSTPGCTLLDVSLGDADGLDVQDILSLRGATQPVIFVTGHDEAATGVRAMKAGALDYLVKPIEESVLLTAVASAIEADRLARRRRGETREFREKLEALTPREHEVMDHVAKGRLNKQIAHDLGIVEKTVKVHRARMMEKIGMRSVAVLVQALARLEGSSGKKP
jgi:FixJ family two-component response regulator